VPEGALEITMHNPNGPQAFYEQVLAAIGNDKSKPIAVMCAYGNRSNWAQGFLRKAGFTNVLDMSEGMFGRGAKPGWLKRGLPVKRSESC
jgi:rhodanese-related sulfurtransferase